MALVACPDCSRHIRRSEVSCPFCGAAVAARIAEIPERFWPSKRLSRAALMTFAATAGAAALGACSSSSSTVTHYGAPIPPQSAGGSGTGGAGGGALPAYGGSVPPPGAGGTATDAGRDAEPDGAHTGGKVGAGGHSAAPLYGLPAKS